MSEPIGLFKIRVIAGIVFAVCLILYSVFAFYDYFEGPKITIQSPTDGHATSSSVIHIIGSTKHATSISLNNRPIYIDESGKFDEMEHLELGYNIIRLRIQDRFGRILEKQFYINRITEK